MPEKIPQIYPCNTPIREKSGNSLLNWYGEIKELFQDPGGNSMEEQGLDLHFPSHREWDL